VNSEMKELLEALGKQIAPMVDAAVKTAVAAASPVAAVVADPVIDAIDAYVIGLLGGTEPPAVTSTEDPIVALQKHVAALTVATGHASSTAMTIAKANVPSVKDAPASEG
jgi:hypothetical protein